MADAATIMWFRNDLRVTDNPALAQACANGGPVVPLFILDDDAPGSWSPGGASRWWLHHSLASLGRDLKSLGSPLILRRGRTGDILREIASACGARHVTCSRSFEPWASRLESQMHDLLATNGISLARFRGGLLAEPELLRTGAGSPYKVFTPFWRALAGLEQRVPVARPRQLRPPPRPFTGDDLASWQLLPSKPDWAAGLRDAWKPGEGAADARLDQFLDERLARYNLDRDQPGREGTSRLSPHLHFGEISPAVCWRRAVAHAAGEPGSQAGLDVFLKELAWREFSHHLLHHVPDLPDAPLRSQFQSFPWRDDAPGLRAWQRGRTGFPIVDAGMRELWSTGWMHNRVRMIVASFLIKDLLISWQHGEAWFWDTLVDADLANNAASWQWVAGSGADAAPYFRIFNPRRQGESFDPEGAYVRRWVPEIAALPDAFIHEPAAAPREALARAGIVLGKTYPSPIVDHAEARMRALAAYAQVKDGAARD